MANWIVLEEDGENILGVEAAHLCCHLFPRVARFGLVDLATHVRHLGVQVRDPVQHQAAHYKKRNF